MNRESSIIIMMIHHHHCREARSRSQEERSGLFRVQLFSSLFFMFISYHTILPGIGAENILTEPSRTQQFDINCYAKSLILLTDKFKESFLIPTITQPPILDLRCIILWAYKFKSIMRNLIYQ